MKKNVRIFLPVLAALVFSFSAAAQDSKSYRIEDIPNVQLGDESRFVSNPDGILSASAVYRIDTMLHSLKKSGKAQVAVVAVNSIGYDEPRDFIFRLIERWGVGAQGSDNGLGIILVVDQGAIEIQTGYGLEGDLPDAIVKRVINNYMLPAFRQRDFDAGMVDGINALYEILNGRPPEEVVPQSSAPVFMIVLVCLFFGLPMLALVIVMLFANRCPRCHKNKLKRTDSHTIARGNGFKTEEITYVCQNCGYVKKVKRNINGPGASGGGPIIGGMGGFGGFGGGHRGGGSGGGSWGGGGFGGGGAGGRF